MIKLNGNPVIPTIFPDKTSQVWKLKEITNLTFCMVEWIFESEAELMHLAQLKMLLDEYNYKPQLYMPYLPYGRQDKDIDNNSTFALHAFAKLINKLSFSQVYTHDPHSNACFLINNMQSVMPIKFVRALIDSGRWDVLAYPDHGASYKYTSHFIMNSVYAKKERDPLTGEIIAMFLAGDFSVKDRAVLIVDDICDGGATFVNFAKLLYQEGASRVDLYVSHGLFTKGLQVLRDAGIEKIFTKDGEIQ